MYYFSFEKLVVWQDSRKLVKEIYLLTETFPKTEIYGICSQMQRASVSVSSNIVEGSSRLTAKDQSRFYTISFSSLTEVLSQLILAVDLGFMKEELLIGKFRPQIEKIALQLNALCKSRKCKN